MGVKYSEIKTGDVFIFNDIKSMPKRKTEDGYMDLVTGAYSRDKDIPDTFKNDNAWEVWDEEEKKFWVEQLKLTLLQ